MKTLILYVFAQQHIWGKQFCTSVKSLKEMVKGGGTTGENQRELGKKLKFGDELTTKGEKPDGENFSRFKDMVTSDERVGKANYSDRTTEKDIAHMVIACNNNNVLDTVAPDPKKHRRKMHVWVPSSDYAEGGKFHNTTALALINSMLEVIDPVNARHLPMPGMKERREHCIAKHAQVLHQFVAMCKASTPPDDFNVGRFPMVDTSSQEEVQARVLQHNVEQDPALPMKMFFVAICQSPSTTLNDHVPHGDLVRHFTYVSLAGLYVKFIFDSVHLAEKKVEHCKSLKDAKTDNSLRTRFGNCMTQAFGKRAQQ